MSDHAGPRRTDPAKSNKAAPPRRVSGANAPVKRTSDGHKTATPAARPASPKAAVPVSAPAKSAAPPSVQAPKRKTDAQRLPNSERAPLPVTAPETKVVAKAQAVSERKSAPSSGSSRGRWKAIVGALAVACVGLGATAAWLWLAAPANHAGPVAEAKDGKEKKAPAGETPAHPVSNPSGTPAANQAATAKFLGRDDKTSGNWKKRYGKDGFVIFNKNGGGQHEVQLPPYLTEASCTGDCCVWAVNEDVRGLEDPADPKRRYIVCMYSGSDFMLSVKALRSIPYRMSLYCLDGDKLGRKQKIEVLDGDKVLHATDVENMENGAWLTYEVKGSVDVRFINTTQINAVFAGVFFDTDESLKVAKRTPSKGPVPENAEQLKPGLWAEYFDKLPTYPNVKDVPTCRRAETNLSFGTMQPGPALRWPFLGACAAIFGGFVKIPEDGQHLFFLQSDDGSRLYIDGELAVDNDGRHPFKEASKQLELKAGLHRIWIEYYNFESPMGLNVLYQGKDGKKGPFPEGMLFYDPNEILSESGQIETAVANR